MKNILLKLGLIALPFACLTLQSCDDDDDDGGVVVEDFVPDNSTFAGWENWTLVETVEEPSLTLGEMAHGGQDSSFVRKIYIKDNAKRENGEYPMGTVIVKHSYSEDQDINEYTAMAKRKADFNTEGAGWEWFMLAADGSIAVNESNETMRGANLMDGMCQGCHGSTTASDFVFTDQ